MRSEVATTVGPELILVPESDRVRALHAALDAGINFWDTADVYGWKLGERITEKILGNYFAQGGGRRDKVVLATKVYNKVSEWPNGGRLSKMLSTPMVIVSPGTGGRMARLRSK